MDGKEAIQIGLMTAKLKGGARPMVLRVGGATSRPSMMHQNVDSIFSHNCKSAPRRWRERRTEQ